MKSVIVKVRLKPSEDDMLKRMVASEVAGCENAAEWFRMILWREWRRRRSMGRVQPKDYQTSFRTGRPQKEFDEKAQA